MKVYILIKDNDETWWHIEGVFATMTDAVNMKNSFGKDADRYIIDEQEVIE